MCQSDLDPTQALAPEVVEERGIEAQVVRAECGDYYLGIPFFTKHRPLYTDRLVWIPLDEERALDLIPATQDGKVLLVLRPPVRA